MGAHLAKAVVLVALAGILACDKAEAPSSDDDVKSKSSKKSKKDDDDKAGGCAKDTDCKGDRVCQAGACVEPGAKASSAPASNPAPAPGPAPGPAPPTPTQGGGSNVPAPAEPAQPSATFVPVALEAWQPRLGPKMVAGSKVVHTVFEGPFGPSPRSLIAVTERPDQSYFVYVMGDDNAPWPAGPLAEVGTHLANKITAVSFFDADKDGVTDLLVMALYNGPSGDLRNKNALLKWTDKGLRRLLNLEPRIEHFDSAEAVQRELAK
jgi:hypothetical protein